MPNGWACKELSSFCNIQKGTQYDRTLLNNEGTYPCINGGIEPSGYVESWNTKANTIIISEGGNSCGYVNWIKSNFWADSHCYRLLDIDSEIDVRFLYFAMKSQQQYIMDLRVGSGLPNIQKKAISEFTLCFPSSINEQQRIATTLTTMDEAIGQTEALINKYTNVKTGLMQDLLTHGIDENGNIRSEQTHKFKDSPLGRIPDEWECVELEMMMKPIDAQPDHRTPTEVVDGYPYVGISDIDELGNLSLDKCRKVDMSVVLKQQKAFQIEEGDIIFGKIGTIGKPKILPITKEPYALSANVILIKPYEYSPFLFYTLNSNYIKTEVELAIHSTSQPAFGMEKIRKLLIKKPKGKECNKIISILMQIDAVIQSNEISLNKCKSQREGLLHDLLTGKVRV